uniref:E1A binding protein p400 n=1 Tax=Callorhinchus milii TaxID=7868 RepID=A0A4W3J6N5_CALMI
MHHGSGPQNVQRSLQRSRSYTGGEGDEPAALAQSPGLSPVPHTVASPSAPQSPSYQKLVKSRSPVSAQNVNITLQNLGQVMAGNQQITLTSHPNQNPVSPGYQYSSQAVGQQRRFEHGSPSYIQVTSPLSQIQPQSPTQHSPVSMQALQNVQRTGTAAAGLNMCNQSPTRGFVDSNVLVRQLNLSPSSTGHFVYQDASGLTQITSSASGQLQLTASASSASVQRERRLSQPHSHTGGTIHHLGPQSPVASGAMQPLPSPSHITTSNLPPQISSIIQGLHGQQMTRSANYERTAVSLATVVGPPPFAMGSPPPPSSPSRTATSALCLASSNNCVTIMRKHSKRLEEIPPATPEIAQTRKQCWEHHVSETETLRETFKDYLVELFFLQHLQGNMMDFLAFRRKPCVPLMAYLKQNDLDLEEEEEEEQSEVINDEVKVVTGKDGQTGTPVAIATQLPPNVSAAFSTQQQQQFQQTHQGTPVAGTANTVEIEAFKRQQAFTLTDQSKRPRIEGGRHGMVFQHTSVTLGSPAVVSLQQLMPTVQGGMPPTPQTLQLGGQKQNQQQYDPSKGPPVKNAATLHTPPPQLPARLQASALSLASLPASLQLAQQQTEVLLQPQTQLHAQTQASNLAQENQIHQRIAELRKEGLWSVRRLPRLQEAPRAKCHWDYLLEEMQWMATDFAQERKWKMGIAKKLARTVVRHHEEQKLNEEKAKKEQCAKLRRRAAVIAREVQHFWYNIEKVNCFHADLAHPEQDVTIDSLLSVDQYRGAERLNTGPSEGKRPRKDIAEVAGAAELLLPKGLARCTALVKSSTPLLLHGSLREYQQVGLDWLASLNRRKLNGILADETRLGKTVQIIAFLAHLACNEGIWGPHLVVVRTCKMLDWEMEFKRWCPGLKIMMYFGTRKERRGKRECWMEPNSFHVCITSYKLLLKDHQAFVKKRWKYLVLDEVQQLRNTTERHWEAFFNLKSQQRLLLIGTPLQNTLMELWTMMHFLMPGISRHYLDFPVKTGTDENQDYCHKLVIRMHRMIQPFILRRSKRDVEKQLPKKYEHILKCCLSKRQRNLYEDVMSQTSTREALRTGRFISVLNALIQLRKICNHPNLVSTRCVRSSFVCEQLHYSTASLVLKALEYDTWKNVDMSIFNLSGIENKRPRYESEVGVPLRKVTRKLIEEIYNSPDLPPRPKPVKMKVSKLFHPVQYGQKPDDRTVVMVSAHPQRTANTASSIATHHVSARGKPPGVAMSAAPGQGEVVSIGQLASIAGGQGRGTQTSQPVTLHFQGNKFTLSSSQLRQLTAGQHLQIQGTCNVLQIVSAPGQQIVRQQGQVVMQSPSHANAGNALHSASAALGNQHGIASSSIATSTPGKRCTVYDHLACIVTQYLNRELREQLTKERLDRIFVINERRSSVKPVYGTELLGICFMMGEYKLPKSKPTLHWWGWSGYVNCCSVQQPDWRSTEPILRHPFTQSNALSFYSIQCVIPNVVVLPPRLYIFNPPPTYTHKTRLFNHNLKQELAPYHQHRPHIAATAVLQLSDPRLVQFDSGKLEALAVLLQKLRSEARRVLVFTQMVRMLDILESFLDYHRFVFVRIDGNTHLSQRQVYKRIFCAILCSRSAAVGVNLVDADTVVVYDGDLNPTLDGQVQEWCDRIGNCKDIHIYRLVSGNSIEEKLLKNGTKNLIRDVALQGSNYSMAYLQQQTVRDLFEVTVFGDSALKVKTEEFVVLSQVPSLVNQISPKETKPFLEEYVNEGADGQNETMPIWTPPTPPQDDNDIYMDPVMCLMYETTAIAESKLPPVYVRKEHKRLKLDASAAGKKFKKARHGEAVSPPRSLFDRAAPCILKMRREAKDQKKNMFLKQQAPFAKPLPSFSKQTVDGGQDSPEWLISEDWALLQAVKQLLELPLSLAIISPAHTPNWDLVSDVVNSCSHIYRSPKQCRNRYENVIIPREEGKLIYDANPKKKTKSIYKTKNSRPLRTSQIYAQDESAMHTQRFTSHFELVKLIAGKRSPPIKPMLGMNPFQKNPKNASVLAESGINYDKPLTPIQVASLRAERIAKEKKQTGAIKTAAGTANIQTATVSGNVIVNTATGIQQSTFQPINKRITQPVIPGTLTTAGGTAAQVVHGQQRTVPTSAATEVVAIATNQGVRAAITPVTAAVVSTSLSPAQSQTRSLVTQVTPGKARVPTSQLQTQTQPASTTQVTLAKPSVVPVPAGVVPSGVTTLPVTVAGISVAIAQPQKGTPGKYHLHRRFGMLRTTGQQVQVIPTTATAQVVQQQLIQHQVVTAASPQIQTPPPQSPAQTATPSEVQGQQAKVQVRTTPAVRLKAPTKPN